MRNRCRYLRTFCALLVSLVKVNFDFTIFPPILLGSLLSSFLMAKTILRRSIDDNNDDNNGNNDNDSQPQAADRQAGKPLIPQQGAKVPSTSLHA